jgi:hypothetical protein
VNFSKASATILWQSAVSRCHGFPFHLDRTHDDFIASLWTFSSTPLIRLIVLVFGYSDTYRNAFIHSTQMHLRILELQ